MNADEIVKGLQVEITCENCPHNNLHESECFTKGCYFVNAAALIESLQAQIAKEKRRADRAVEDLKLDSHCTLCKHHLSEGGDCYGVSKCAAKGIRVGWQWRGDAEEYADRAIEGLDEVLPPKGRVRDERD
jgi:hypothetical protein